MIDRPKVDDGKRWTTIHPLRRATLFPRLGPGLITGAADDDPSGMTYSQAGAQFGVNMLWTMLFLYPLMSTMQMISARIGRVTGHGLATNMRQIFPPWAVTGLVALLFIANTINSAPISPPWGRRRTWCWDGGIT
jgi:Mn2+/Fe2+ NRAMP family transporter